MQRWKSYWHSDVARAADPATDLHLIERWICDVDEYERIRPKVAKRRMAKGSTGQLKLSPMVSYLETIRARIEKAENALGLSPRARAQLGLTLASAQLAHNRAKQASVPPDVDDDDADERVDPRLRLVQ